MNAPNTRHLLPLWGAVGVLLVLAALVMAQLAALEFGPLKGRAIAVDEVFFAVCAARDNAIGALENR